MQGERLSTPSPRQVCRRALPGHGVEAPCHPHSFPRTWSRSLHVLTEFDAN